MTQDVLQGGSAKVRDAVQSSKGGREIVGIHISARRGGDRAVQEALAVHFVSPLHLWLDGVES